MAERLYLQDAYTSNFAARIVERVLLPDGRLAVVLDRTAFCPGGGGLLADRGFLNRAQVIQVTPRESDGEILHVLSEEIWEDQAQGRIDWPRRIDGMRQHTAGHLLSSVFAQVCGAAAAGIGVTEREAFLDLDHDDVSPAHIEQVEAAANELTLGNRAVRVAMVDAAQASKLGLTVPLTEKIIGSGAARPFQVVGVEGMGIVACNGVHVARTGELGLIRVTGAEPLGKRSRVRFVAGARALSEVRRVDQMLAQIAASLGVTVAQAAPAVTRLMVELNATQAELETVRGKVLGAEADVLAVNAEAVSGVRLVRRIYAERDVAEVRQLAHLITAKPGLVALLGVAGRHAQLVFARSSDVSFDMTVPIRVAAQMLNAQGGGQPSLAQSTPVRADEGRVEAAIVKAVKVLRA
jgi:alanyl-tRNA synthetase